MSVIKSSAAEYPCTSALRPVRLKRSRMYSSSTSQKYSLPFEARNQLCGGRSVSVCCSEEGSLGGYRKEGRKRTKSTSWRKRRRKRGRGRPLQNGKASQSRPSLGFLESVQPLFSYRSSTGAVLVLIAPSRPPERSSRPFRHSFPTASPVAVRGTVRTVVGVLLLLSGSGESVES